MDEASVVLEAAPVVTVADLVSEVLLSRMISSQYPRIYMLTLPFVYFPILVSISMRYTDK